MTIPPRMAPSDTPEPLNTEQRARAAALQRARAVLAARGAMSSGPVDAIDLVNVAQWIMDGLDPWPPRPAVGAPAASSLAVEEVDGGP